MGCPVMEGSRQAQGWCMGEEVKGRLARECGSHRVSCVGPYALKYRRTRGGGGGLTHPSRRMRFGRRPLGELRLWLTGHKWRRPSERLPLVASAISG